MTVALAIREAAEALAGVSDTPRLDAELLVAHVLGMSRSDMLLRAMDTPVPEGVARLVVRRLNREPVAYIVGRQEFYGREFQLNNQVLIPRGDSETVVRAALAAKPTAKRVLDLGVGSGALLLSVLAELPAATGIGIDASTMAWLIAAANIESLQLKGRAQIYNIDWNDPAMMTQLGTFDLVLANPPYVEDDAELAPEVRDHEPAQALFAGADGLDAYRVLIPQLDQLLEPDGVAVFEIGHTQAEAVTALAAAAGYGAELHRDLGNRPRALVLTKTLAQAG